MEIGYKYIRSQIPSIVLGLLAVVLAVVKSWALFQLPPLPSWVWALLACVALVPALLLGRKPKVNPLLVALLGACLLSTGWNRPDGVFHSYQRLIYFALSLCVLSPLLSNLWLHRLRRAMWLTSLLLMRLAVIASLVVYVAYHLGYIAPDVVESASSGVFGGVTTHPVLLGYVSALVAMAECYSIFFDTGLDRRKLALHVAMASLALLCMVLTGSRMSVASCFAGLALLAGWALRRNWRRALLMIAIVGATTSALCIANVVGDTFRGLNSKIAYNDSLGGQLSSRIHRWTDRLNEFQDSPLVGIGFCAQTRSTSPFDEHDRIFAEGSLEPGSSWLAVAAMTGILGLSLMVAFNVVLALRIFRSRRDPCRQLWLALLVVLWLSGLCEGWIYFAGSYLFFIYWLLSGLAWDNADYQGRSNHQSRDASSPSS